MQLDQGEKGFSFSKEGPLDMRMNNQDELTAETIVNTWSEKDLGALLQEYGEERRWRLIARGIVEARKRKKIQTTTQLAELIVSLFKGRGKIHPATLTFQALRICVNQELDSLQVALAKAIDKLPCGGKIGVISFHSLEDRIVKNVFKAASFASARQKKIQGMDKVMPALKLLTKKPIMATLAEMRSNPRARSAKLRFAEKIT